MGFIQKERLKTMGAKQIKSRINGWGKTEWFGLLSCSDCKKFRWVSSHSAGLKAFSGRCLSCSGKRKADQILNSPEGKLKRCKGKAHYFYRQGFTLNDSGYRIIHLALDSPFRKMAGKNGYIREHRLVMAKHLGRLLKSWEIVHHKDKNRQNNSIENLELLTVGVHQLVTKMEAEIVQLQTENERLKCQLKLVK